VDDRRRQPQYAVPPGITKDSLPEGTQITVDGYQAKDGSNKATGAM